MRMAGQVRTVHVIIEGRVQGVGYRAWTEAAAMGLALSGWVRNRRDGTVEAVFQGPAENVAEMLDRCATGPYAANVTRVDAIGGDTEVFSEFEVRSTV